MPGAFRVRSVSRPGAEKPGVVAAKPLYLPPNSKPYHLLGGATFPTPELPPDNPLTEERVALGEKLFRETAL